MDYPKYKEVYRKIKCYKTDRYVNCVTTYKYIPDKNVYKTLYGSCSNTKCNGITKYGIPCVYVNPLPHEFSPDSPELGEQTHLTD